MPRIKIGKKGTAYVSDDLREEGYIGEIMVRPNACAAVMERPGASKRDIAKSLEILKAHYEHLAEIEERSSNAKE